MASDSFTVQLDGGARTVWSFPNGKPWRWNAVTIPWQYWTLGAGAHTLTIWSREPGARLDAVEITDQNPGVYQPSWVSP